MAARFWVGGAGTWDAVNTANWSATTGGAGGASAPTTADTVTFDNLSGSGIVTTTAGAATSGITYDSSTLTSLTLGANITIASSGNFTFTRGSIDLNNFTIGCYNLISFNSNTRSIAFGASGAIIYGASIAFIGTNFSYTGTSSICLGFFTIGVNITTNTGFTESNALNHKILASWSGSIGAITSGSVFNDLTWESGFTGSGSSFNAATITLYGSVTLQSGMTFGTATGTWTFARTSGTQTITSAGKTLCNIIINGPGGTVTLGDALTIDTSRTLTVTSGTFTTSANSYSVSAPTLSSSGSLIRTITLNASTVTLNGSTPTDFTTAANLTFNAGTSQINYTTSITAGTINGGSQTFANVRLDSQGFAIARTITGTNIFGNLTLVQAAGGIDINTLILSNDQTVSGTFTCGGPSVINRNFVRSNTIGQTRTITANALSAADCDFRDITLAGAAAGTSPTRAGDCGGNSGITFPAAKTVYWNLAGTQNWSATAWATTSNGAPSVNNFPLAQDTATFTDSGSAGTITWFVTFNVGNIDASNRTSAITLDQNRSFNYYGSYTLGSGVTVSGTAVQTFSGRDTQTFTSAGKTITFPIVVDKPAGAFELNGATTTTNTITHTRGTLDAKIYNLTCTTFASNNSNTRTLTMGSGLWTVSGTGTVWNTSTVTGLTFAANTANILLSNDSTLDKTITSGISQLPKLTIGGTSSRSAAYNISGNYAELAYTRTITSNLVFSTTAGVTNIGVWSVSGSAAYPINIRSSSGGSRAQINVTTRTSGIDYLNISDINIRNFGSGANPYLFYAGDNSVNGSSNANIAFISSSVESPQTVYLLEHDTTGNPAGVWITPNDWDSNNNIIHMIGPGGGGNGSPSVSGNLRSAAGGGGGGAYVRLTNFPSTPGSNVSYYVWAGVGASAANAAVTGWSSNTYIANGGQRGTTVAGISSTGGRGGAASAITGIITASFAGGNGGSGAFGNAAGTGHGSGGGGGAGGPFGKGGDGGRGVSSTVAANVAGGGGGGGGGGSNGGDASAGLSGAGGTNYLGAEGGQPSSSSADIAANGAGSSGATSTSGVVYFPPGGRDMIAGTLGSGGGAGGHGGTSGAVSVAENFGSGGAGFAVTTAGVIALGGSSPQPGAIFIIYPVRGSTRDSNMFLLF